MMKLTKSQKQTIEMYKAIQENIKRIKGLYTQAKRTRSARIAAEDLYVAHQCQNTLDELTE